MGICTKYGEIPLYVSRCDCVQAPTQTGELYTGMLTVLGHKKSTICLLIFLTQFMGSDFICQYGS